MKRITSLQNPLIKNITLLGAKAAERKLQQRFVAEGLREVQLALRNRFAAEQLLFDENQVAPQTIIGLIPPDFPHEKPDIIAVSEVVFEKIAYRSGVPNVVGVFQSKNYFVDELRLPDNPLVLILENVEKPGNLGAILRTADAAGVNAVLLCDPQTEVFNPNAIRASLGAIFTVPVFTLSSTQAADFLRQRSIPVVATWLEACQSLYDCDLRGPLAVVLGSEAAGISNFWVKRSNKKVIIPMRGQCDSLNVAASAAIVLFEVLRQRHYHVPGSAVL